LSAMSNLKFEELLQKLPHALAKGLGDLKFSQEMHDQVRMRLKLGFYEKPDKLRKPALAAATAALAMLCLVGVSAGIWWWKEQRDPAARHTAMGPYFEEIETIDIDLDGKEPLELVNTWRIREPDYGETLMAIIWTRDDRGQLNVTSTHSFEGSEFFPLLVLSPATEKRNYVLIASTDKANRIYYCVLGYDGNQVYEYKNLLPVSFEYYEKQLGGKK